MNIEYPEFDYTAIIDDVGHIELVGWNEEPADEASEEEAETVLPPHVLVWRR